MNFFLSIALGYALGCFPSALIISKRLAGKNPGKMGSKNYGALNSFEITGSKKVGIIVFLLDVLKGIAAVFLTWNFIFPKSIYIVLTAIAAVAGHCFNPFFKFKGGRGLATVLGASIMFNPLILIVWGLLWLLFRIVKKNIIFQNMWACIISPFVIYWAPQYLFYIANYNYYVTLYDYKIYSIIVCAIIFIAHIRTNKFKLFSE